MLGRLALPALGASLVAGLLFARAYVRLPAADGGQAGAAGAAARWAAPPPDGPYDWTVFQNPNATVPPSRGELAKRFRLAGTFFAFGGGAGDSRKAILENTEGGAHRIVSEGDSVDGVTVVRVFRDSVILRSGASEEQLWLSFSRASEGQEAAAAQAEAAAARGGDIGETDRFGGKRIGECRWVFKRQAVMDYYAELRDEPERLVKIFDSMKPVYSQDRKITGYQLGIEGEADFFASTGLQQGDVVTSVNSMEMTSRNRAEYFIKEFIADRANAFVLDVQRGGNPLKLMYEVR
jgi:hypothetical protein